jgi:hypothetical protein
LYAFPTSSMHATHTCTCVCVCVILHFVFSAQTHNREVVHLSSYFTSETVDCIFVTLALQVDEIKV